MNYGTKANNLLKMSDNQINVPCFIVLSWEEIVGQDYEIEDLIKDIDYTNKEELEKVSISLQMLVGRHAKENIKDINIDEKFAKVLGDNKRINEFSVRSSTANEDGEATSFAGQFDTYLNVGYAKLNEYIIRCIKSLYKVNVLSYCGEQGISPLDLKINVIIQEMIEPEYSGILFTSNPSGLLNESVIVVGPGVGSLIVEDKVDTTTYYYNTTDDIYYYETQSDECVILSEERVNELIGLSKKLINIFGDKLDIEFAVADGVLYILQARRITTLKGENILILDNSNIVESYPGISLPFTDSFVNLAYTGVFRGLCNRLINDEEYLEKLEDVYSNMVGSCNGRMYYKISNWYMILKGMPQSKKIIKNWQEMLGVTIKNYDDDKIKVSPFTKMAVYGHIFKELKNVSKNMEDLNEKFWKTNEYFNEKFSKDLTNKELIELFENIRKKVLDDWDITLINDMYAFIYTGMLKSMLKMDRVKDYEMVTNEYISGISNIESMKPIKELLMLTKLAIEKNMVGKKPSKDEEFEKAFNEYIEKYGDRAMEELKIESKTFRSNPELLIEKIQCYAQDEKKLNDMCKSMEQEKCELDKDTLKKVCVIDKKIIQSLSKKAMLGIQNREISRLNRSRIYGIVRSIALRIGKNFEREDILESYEDIFYLYLDEIRDYVNDNEIRNFKELVRERKDKYKLYKELPAYSRLVFAGEVTNKSHFSINSVDIEYDCKNLCGTPCSPGEVTAQVLVINDVSEAKDVKDKILVTKMTDPGWVFLLVEAKGIITEKGSLLSHTAIISRELNIPSVVGVKDVCSILKSGDKVRLDGNTGEIVKL